MIMRQELLKANKLPEEFKFNFEELFKRMNAFRTAYGNGMIVTSGLRTLERDMELSPNSKNRLHTKALACDISDPRGELKAWIKKNISLCEEIGLWFEHFDHTPTWVHFQIIPPPSGERFFRIVP